jgi:hypothetical protein
MRTSTTPLLALLLLTAASAALAAPASAQTDASTIPAARSFVSPERFVIELRGGPFKPDLGDNQAFTRFFGGDSGPFIGAQLHYIAYRLPDLAYLTIGGGFGWSSYTGKAIAAEDPSEDVAEETSLTLLPLSAVASIRIDALPRNLQIPFIFTGKLGYQWTNWDTNTGAEDDASGWSLGPLFGAQIALDLDTFDSAAARGLDEDWGINHSFLFFEVYHFAPSDESLPVGGTSWLLGLGFTF